MVTLKTSSRHVLKTSSKDEDERRLQDVFIKANVCWESSNSSIHLIRSISNEEISKVYQGKEGRVDIERTRSIYKCNQEIIRVGRLD